MIVQKDSRPLPGAGFCRFKISTKAGAVQKSKEVILLDEENIELYLYGDIKRQLQGKQPTIEDVYFYLYEGWSVYDDPLAAMSYCSVI